VCRLVLLRGCTLCRRLTDGYNLIVWLLSWQAQGGGVRRVRRTLQAWVKRERRLKALASGALPDSKDTAENKAASVVVPREVMRRWVEYHTHTHTHQGHGRHLAP
jgi:hypothetical protein